jgi:hypothetical protein
LIVQGHKTDQAVIVGCGEGCYNFVALYSLAEQSRLFIQGDRALMSTGDHYHEDSDDTRVHQHRYHSCDRLQSRPGYRRTYSDSYNDPNGNSYFHAHPDAQSHT